MYAVVATGGKQFRVAEGDIFRTEKIDAPVGDTVELDNVVLVARDDGLVVDPEALKNSKVICRVMSQDKAKKIRVFKKKRRKNYTRTYGHRQAYTALRVQQIQV